SIRTSMQRHAREDPKTYVAAPDRRKHMFLDPLSRVAACSFELKPAPLACFSSESTQILRRYIHPSSPHTVSNAIHVCRCGRVRGSLPHHVRVIPPAAVPTYFDLLTSTCQFFLVCSFYVLCCLSPLLCCQ